jgi:hypothetical protein
MPKRCQGGAPASVTSTIVLQNGRSLQFIFGVVKVSDQKYLADVCYYKDVRAVEATVNMYLNELVTNVSGKEKAQKMIVNMDVNNFTPLYAAACRLDDDPSVVNYLLRLGADPQLPPEPGSHGFYPLHGACACGNINTVLALIANAQTNVNQIGGVGRVPLHSACEANDQDDKLDKRTKIVRALLEKGATPWATRVDGLTPLDLALRKKLKDVAAVLLGKMLKIIENPSRADQVDLFEVGFNPLRDEYPNASVNASIMQTDPTPVKDRVFLCFPEHKSGNRIPSQQQGSYKIFRMYDARDIISQVTRFFNNINNPPTVQELTVPDPVTRIHIKLFDLLVVPSDVAQEIYDGILKENEEARSKATL